MFSHSLSVALFFLCRGTPPLTRLFKSFAKVAAAAQQKGGHDVEKLATSCLHEIIFWERYARMTTIAETAQWRERELYEKQREQAAWEVEEVKQKVIERKRDLADAQAWRSRNEEYEALKRKIMAFPSRPVNRDKSAAVQAKIESLQMRRVAVEAGVLLRRRQIQALVDMAWELQREMNDEDLVVSMDETQLKKLQQLDGMTRDDHASVELLDGHEEGEEDHGQGRAGPDDDGARGEDEQMVDGEQGGRGGSHEEKHPRENRKRSRSMARHEEEGEEEEEEEEEEGEL